MWKGYDKFRVSNGGEAYGAYLEHERKVQGVGRRVGYGDYLAHEERTVIRHFGPLCERVGWEQGAIMEPESYAMVSRNMHALTGEQLTKEARKWVEIKGNRKTKRRAPVNERKTVDGKEYELVSSRRMHLDNTISMPKSFSNLAILGQADWVLDMHDAAVNKCIEYFPHVIGCRNKGRDGTKKNIEYTGKYAGTRALHYFSRAGDADVHTHLDVISITEGANSELYAIDNGEVMNQYSLLTEIYRCELTRLALGRGLEIGKGKSSEPVIKGLEWMDEKYSTRANQLTEIADYVEQHVGLKLNEMERGLIIRYSRGFRKEQFEKGWEKLKAARPVDLDPATAVANWRLYFQEFAHLVEQCSDQRVGPETADELLQAILLKVTPEEQAALDKAKAVRSPLEPVKLPTLSQSIEHAIEHVYHGRSVVKDRELYRAIVKHARGTDVNMEEVRKRIAEHSGLVIGEYGEIGSKDHWHKEKECQLWLEQGRKCGKSVSIEGIDRRLNRAQYQCVRGLLRSGQQFTAISSSSGVGKTSYAIPEIIAANVRAGHRVAVVALTEDAMKVIRAIDKLPPGSVAQPVMRDAKTLQFWMTKKLYEGLGQDDLLVIDEMSFASLKQGHEVMQCARERGFRVCFVADVDQGNSNEAGDFYRLMLQMGVAAEGLHDIQRQKEEALGGHYLKSVKAFKQGKVKGKTTEAWSELFQAGCIEELQGKSRVDAYAQEYIKTKDEGMDCMVINLSHRENELITDEIRTRLKERGELYDERLLGVHGTLGWSDAEKKEVHNILPGMVVEWVVGKDKGRRWQIFENNDGIPRGRADNGAVRDFGAKDYEYMDVCGQSTKPFAIGDWILCRTKNKAGKLANQERLQIQAWDSRGNPVCNGKSVEHRNITHGICHTGRACQGSETTKVLTGLDRFSTKAWTRELAYVIAGRGEKYIKVFCESAIELATIGGRSSQRKAVSEMPIASDRERPKDIVALEKQIERAKELNTMSEPTLPQEKSKQQKLSLPMQHIQRAIRAKEAKMKSKRRGHEHQQTPQRTQERGISYER